MATQPCKGWAVALLDLLIEAEAEHLDWCTDPSDLELNLRACEFSRPSAYCRRLENIGGREFCLAAHVPLHFKKGQGLRPFLGRPSRPEPGLNRQRP